MKVVDVRDGFRDRESSAVFSVVVPNGVTSFTSITGLLRIRR